MEWLASESPDIFEASHSEAQAPGVPPGEHKKTACEVCGELANARGWGNPACYVCAGVDSHCLPISQHMFGVLLQSRYPGCQSHSEESRTASKHSDDLMAEDFDNETLEF